MKRIGSSVRRMRRGFWRNVGEIPAMVLTVLLISGCGTVFSIADRLGLGEYFGVTDQEYESVVAWLLCEECVDGELTRVENIGFRATHIMDTVLAEIPPTWRAGRRRHFRIGAQTLGLTGAEFDEFVSRYEEYFVAATQKQAISGLTVTEGWDDLRKALREAPNRNYRPDVLYLIQEALFQRAPAEEIDRGGVIGGTVQDAGGTPVPQLPVIIHYCVRAQVAYSPPQGGRSTEILESTATRTDSIGAFSLGEPSLGFPEGVYQVEPAGDYPPRLFLLLGPAPNVSSNWN